MRLRVWHTVFIVVVAIAAGLLLFGISADAQCSMCRAAIRGANDARFIRNLNFGVLVLLVPPVTIFCSIFIVLRKYKSTD